VKPGGGFLTCITEHLVLHNDLVAVQGLWVNFIVRVLVGKVEQNLFIKKIIKNKIRMTIKEEKKKKKNQPIKSECDSQKKT